MKYQNIIFDFDSTLVTIEGIDELASLNGVKEEIVKLTNMAMNGNGNTDEIFKKRLDLINPKQQNLQYIAKKYKSNITTGAKELINQLKNTSVFVITGGYRETVLPTTRDLGIKDQNVFANELNFDIFGNYVGINENIPLWKQKGKKKILKQILQKKPGKTAVIGDGYSDYEMAEIADIFICFAGIEYRKKVADLANIVIKENNLIEIVKYL